MNYQGALHFFYLGGYEHGKISIRNGNGKNHQPITKRHNPVAEALDRCTIGRIQPHKQEKLFIIKSNALNHDGEYATFKQWQDLGGHVRKGEKSEIVCFWKILPIEEEQEDGTKEVKQIPLLRYYNVFHISQVDGVEPLKEEELHDIEPIEKAEQVLNDYWTRENITVEHEAGDKAYYSPTFDLIHLPLFEQFTNANEYYSTAFHESVHSAMKEKTLQPCGRQER